MRFYVWENDYLIINVIAVKVFKYKEYMGWYLLDKQAKILPFP
jgi:hypothetical protein